MTRVSVNDIANSMVQGAYAANSTNSFKSAKDAFSSIMGQATGQMNCEDLAKNSETGASANVQTTKDMSQKVKSEQPDVNKGDLQSKVDNAKDAVSEKEQEIKDALCKELGITEEELEQVMAELGLTFVDLMEQSNMVLLVTNLSEGLDAVTIMTDESMFTQVTALTEMVTETWEGLAEELGVTVEELNGLVEQFEQAEVVETVAEVSEADTFEAADLKENVTVEVNAADSEELALGAGVKSTVSDVTKENAEQTMTRQDNQTNEQGMQSFSQTNATQNVAENVTNATQTSFAETTRTQEILDQIAEYVKLNASPDVTEMEIQLNPENLGKVNLQIASKNGIITAQLTAQSEAVRQALETQAFILKDNLQQQGVKVEAIEVTIASHEFERNLEQNQGQNESEEAYEAQLKKATRRRINLDDMSLEDIDKLADDMTEAEMIQIDMMNRNGNKIDFMA